MARCVIFVKAHQKEMAQRNESLLTSAFLRVRHRLHALAAGIVGSAQEADDVLHDAFCKLWLSHKEIANEVAATKLSYTAVRNTAIDAYRRNHSRHTDPVETIGEMADATDAEADKAIVCNELLKLSRRVLDDRRYRVFMMHDVDHIPYHEIASRLSLTEENVRAILSRARKAIREEYRKTLK